MLSFSREQFIAIFTDYNAAVWPAQVLACLLGLVMVVMLVRPSEVDGRLISAGLAAMWIWTGVAYRWQWRRSSPVALHDPRRVAAMTDRSRFGYRNRSM